MSAVIVRFPQQRPYMFGHAPRFDPANAAHVEAWQQLYEAAARRKAGFGGRSTEFLMRAAAKIIAD